MKVQLSIEDRYEKSLIDAFASSKIVELESNNASTSQFVNCWRIFTKKETNDVTLFFIL
jgi:hypothetical protein